MGIKPLNLSECVNCYCEDGLDCRRCVATNLNGVLLHFIMYYLEWCIYINK